LDISTLAALASGQFALSHERLGRNRPENGLHEVHLNNEFFSKMVGSRGTLLDWKPMKVSNMIALYNYVNWSDKKGLIAHQILTIILSL